MMMRFALVATMVALTFGATACRRTDITTVDISVPEMKNEACASVIKTALFKGQRIEPDKVKIDLVGRKVTITYDTMKRALKNLEMEIADAGFQANDIPANEAARASLPAECRE